MSYVERLRHVHNLWVLNGGYGARSTFVMNSVEFHQLANEMGLSATLPATIFGRPVTIDETATDITMREERPDEHRRGRGAGVPGSTPAPAGASAHTHTAGGVIPTASVYAYGGSIYSSGFAGPGVTGSSVSRGYRLIRPDGTVIVTWYDAPALAFLHERYDPPWLYQEAFYRREWHGEWTTRAQSSPVVMEGAYRAWRAWQLKRTPRLSSMVAGYEWTPGWNETRVVEGSVDYVGYGTLGYNPMRETSGGFHGLHTFDDLLCQVAVNVAFDVAPVLGTMVACGRMRKGSRGIRATRARVEAIVLTGDLDRDAELLAVADHYGARCIANYATAQELPTGLFDYHDGD